MQEATVSIIQAYHYIATASGKGYSLASQKSILHILQRYYGVSICRRTLNRRLRAFEDAGWISRIRRHRRGPRGKILFNTTIVILHRPALQKLSRIAHWFRRVGWKLRGWKVENAWRPQSQSQMSPESVLKLIGAQVRHFP